MKNNAEHRQAVDARQADAGAIVLPIGRPATALPECALQDNDAVAVCPQCACLMRLWAGFYRCRNCGFKESCCF